MTKVELDSADLNAILELVREMMNRNASAIHRLYEMDGAVRGLNGLKGLVTADQFEAIRARLVKELTE